MGLGSHSDRPGTPPVVCPPVVAERTIGSSGATGLCHVPEGALLPFSASSAVPSGVLSAAVLFKVRRRLSDLPLLRIWTARLPATRRRLSRRAAGTLTFSILEPRLQGGWPCKADALPAELHRTATTAAWGSTVPARKQFQALT
jgi:hypothetical protein